MCCLPPYPWLPVPSGAKTTLERCRMRASRLLFPLIIVSLVGVLSGCGSSPYHTYNDGTYHFSFEYPSHWNAPQATHGTADSVPSYIVALSNGSSQLRVVVNTRRIDFSPIVNGQVSHQGPNTLVFYRRTVSGLPAILVVQQSQGLPTDHETVHLNTSRYGYDIEIIAANGVSKSQQRDFMHLVSTFKVGSHG